MREFLVYVLYRAGVAIIKLVPLPLLFRAGEGLGFLAWLFLPQYRRLAQRNVVTALGTKGTPAQSKRIVRRHFRRLGANFLCGLKVATIPLETLSKYVDVEGEDIINRHLRDKRGVVLILSHMGNWEVIPQILPKFIGHARNSTIYQALRNRRVDAHVRKLRSRAGVEVFDRREGFARPIELLRGGGAIGILSDQHAGDQGLWTPLFNKLASTTPLPALLAKRTRAALVHVAVYTARPAHWRVVVEPGPDAQSGSVEALTSKANEVIARHVESAPEDWFWVHDRWKTPNPNFLLMRYKRGVYLPPSLPVRTLKRFRILVRSSNWLGDAVMSVPAVRAVKNGRPDIHLTILAPANVAAMWRLVTEVDEVVTLKRTSLFHAVATIEKLGGFDVGILFPNSLRAALEMWLADLPRRVGFRGHQRTWLLNQIVREHRRPAPPEHHSRRFLRIAAESGADIIATKRALTTAEVLSNKQAVDGSAADASTRRTASAGDLQLALSPGAEYGPAKRWLADRFAAVAKEVAETTTAKWVLLGTEKDTEVGRNIAAALGDRCINRMGETTMEELIDQLRACRLLLTNDTGTMHLAALLKIPVVAIFGSTEPALTEPLGENHIIIRHHVECSPCFLRECPIDFRCMHAVAVNEVREAVMSILRRPC
jgi:heptosyltransferase-2